MAAKCVACGVVTQIEPSFHKTRKSFRCDVIFYCPRCWARRQQGFLDLELLFWIVFTVAGLVLLAVPAQRDAGWVMLNISLGFLFVVLVLLPHEFGHALAARLLGWRVFKITLGLGRTVCQGQWAGFRVEINAIPVGGATWAAPRNVAFYRTKHFLFILAGPLANLVLLAAVFACATPHQMFALVPGTGLAPLVVFVCANAFVLGMNLLPYTRTMVCGSMCEQLPTDGLALLVTPFLSQSVIQQKHAAFFLLEGVQCFQERRYEAAKRWHERALELYPEDIPNRMGLGLALHLLKDFQASRQQCLTILNRQDLPPAIRALLLNNIAWVDLMIGGRELLEEADRYSQEAIRSEPSKPPFQGTRGSVLIELGEPEKGLPLVRQALELNEDPRLKALNACYLALGELKRGNWEESQRYEELARNLDPDCLLLEKIGRELARAMP